MTSFFFYLHLRSALNALRIPELPLHSMHRLYSCIRTRGLVSKLYFLLIKATFKPMPIDNIRRKDLSLIPSVINWPRVWSNVLISSRNTYHRMIHYNFVWRSYCTPRKLFLMKARQSPNCTLFTQGIPGTYIHMI